MYERILVPLDGSEMSKTALPYVEELVSKLSPEVKAEVTLFGVVSSLTHYIAAPGLAVPGGVVAPVPYSDTEVEQIKTRVMDYLDKAAESLRSKGAIVLTAVTVGNAAEEIIKAADEIDVDLIAMSTHGRSAILRWAFGSVTDKVLREGNKPVLIIRAPKETA